MPNQISYRQGEVLLIKEESTFEVTDPISPVLAEGEISGHKHEILDGKVVESKWWGRGAKYVLSNGDTTLIHPEHKPIRIDAGLWRVRIQREYSELENVNVAD